ncbi:MAG: FlgD immunoglobulin-like domain containing protein [Candidatus Kapabacteria bacterium]|nr:FlgD immunoglobulin-like domain containing protein [Candidatus Kapabacteria bacterium]
MRKCIFSFALITLLLSISALNAQQNSLRLLDPRNQNRTSKATVDSLTVIVTPLGAYSQISFMVNISTRNTQFNKIQDTLEIESYFNLPENAIVNDSWLWVEDTLVFADLIDRWTAGLIYEDIVKRVRRDPTIFYKNSATAYEFRLFPLAGTKYRKFLISFMIPNDISEDRFKVNIPTISFPLALMPDSVNVLFMNNKNYTNSKFKINNNDFMTMTDDENLFFGKHLSVKVGKNSFLSQHLLDFSAKIENGIHLNTYSDWNEKFYSILMDLKSLIVQRKPVKQLFVIEHVPDNAIQPLPVLLSNLTEKIREFYAAGDSINVLYANNLGEPTLLFPEWVAYEPANADVLLDKIIEIGTKAAAFPVLPALLNSSVQFLTDRDTTGAIVVVASSDNYGSLAIANPILENLLKKSGRKVPIFSIDYANVYGKQYKINNVNYRGNEYLYRTLATQTKGQYFNVIETNYDIGLMLSNFFNSCLNRISDINYYISTDNGFTYQDYEPLKYSTGSYLKLFQVGKYVGGENFKIRLTYMLENEPCIKEINITSEQIIKSNQSLSQIWTGNHLKYLELIAKTNAQIKDIVDLSMAQRVLSRYTAFLALEPWMRDSLFHDDENQDDVDDDGGTTDVSEDNIQSVMNIELNTYPNPATVDCRITILSDSETNINKLFIYDLQGNVVRTIDVNSASAGSEITILWDLNDESGNPVPAGTYYVIIYQGIKSFTHKVSVIR